MFRNNKISNVKHELQISPDTWIKHFNCLLNKKDQSPITLSQEIPDPEYNNILNPIITTEEINKSIKNLKLRKSPGIDGIGTKFYKNTSHIIVPTLCDIFNSIMNSGEFPKGWSESIIVPVHKSGSMTTRPTFEVFRC